MPFIIDPQKISYSSCLNEVNNFLNSLPESNAWINRLDSGIGTTLMQTLTGHRVYLRNKATIARREVFRYYALNRSSLVANANDIGYPVFRGNNPEILLNITPTNSTTISRYEIIGSLKDVDIVSLETINIVKDVPVSIKIVLGKLTESSLNIIDSKINVFRFYDAFNVSDEARILLNNIEVPLTKKYVDLVKDFYLIQTNAFDSIDVFYLNQDNFLNKYQSGDILTLQYIELKNVDYTIDDFNINIGVLNNLTILKNYTIPEENDSIRIKTGLFSITEPVIKGRDDYMLYFRTLDTGFLDTNYRDLTGEQLELTYIKKDNSDNITYLSTLEKNNLKEILTEYRFMGVKPPPIVDPIEVLVNLNIGISFNPDYLSFYPNIINEGFVEDDIKEVLKYEHQDNWKESITLNRKGSRERKLNYVLDLWQIEHELKELPYVKIARVELKTNVWQPNNGYIRGKFVTPTISNNKIYEVMSNFISNVIEPDFNSVANGQYLIEDILTWQPSTNYSLNTLVLPINSNNKIYKCVTAGTSGINPPNFSIIDGEKFLDNTCEWQVFNPLDVAGLKIWLCHNKDETKFKSYWKEFYKLNFGNIIQL